MRSAMRWNGIRMNSGTAARILRTSSPTRFIFGDDVRNSGKIEFVGRPPGLGTPLLIAVVITPDAHGRYNIASFYPVSEGKVQSRKQKGFLKIARRTKI